MLPHSPEWGRQGLRWGRLGPQMYPGGQPVSGVHRWAAWFKAQLSQAGLIPKIDPHGQGAPWRCSARRPWDDENACLSGALGEAVSHVGKESTRAWPREAFCEF